MTSPIHNSLWLNDIIWWNNIFISKVLCHSPLSNLNSQWVSQLLFSITYLKIIFLTHWGWVTHICIGKLTNIGSDNGLSPGRHEAIIWTNAGMLLIGPLGTNFSEMLIEIHTFSFKKIHLNMSSEKWRPFYLGLNVLTATVLYCIYSIPQQCCSWAMLCGAMSGWMLFKCHIPWLPSQKSYPRAVRSRCCGGCLLKYSHVISWTLYHIILYMKTLVPGAGI